MSFSEQYHKNGYVILENVYTEEEVDKIRSIVNNLDIENLILMRPKQGSLKLGLRSPWAQRIKWYKSKNYSRLYFRFFN